MYVLSAGLRVSHEWVLETIHSTTPHTAVVVTCLQLKYHRGRCFRPCCPFAFVPKQSDSDICRADIVCTRCSDGCDDVVDGLTFSSTSTVPAAVCQNLPVGTIASSAGMTLATLELAGGYYRTSNDSHVVLECHRKGSCIGGANSSNYCAPGFKGPCE